MADKKGNNAKQAEQADDDVVVDSKRFKFEVGSGVLVATVTIVDQLGSWTVSLIGNVLGQGTTPKPVLVGQAASLVGKTLSITATIADANPHTDKIELHIRLESGDKAESFRHEVTVVTGGHAHLLSRIALK